MRELWKVCHGTYAQSDYHDRTMLVSVGSVCTNAFIGIGKLALGIFFLSPWFMVTSVYYLLLCTARGYLLWTCKHTPSTRNAKESFDHQVAVCRRSGMFICLLGVSYFLVCLRMYVWGDTSSYPYYIVYGVAAIAFYKIGLSIYGMVVSKRMKSPLVMTMKVISFVDACVSIVAVQCALLSMKNPTITATKSSAVFGAGCSILFIAIGIYMVFRKTVAYDEVFDAERQDKE